MATSVIAVGMENLGDEVLLRRYAARRKPEAFVELARRHTGLVYATCLRITDDRHDAEELAQECFLQLARKAGTVRSSVAGWLHQTATRTALNAVRARGRRRAHEAEAAQAREAQVRPNDPTWLEVEPILDEAVEALPDELREAIILHFLQSLTQAEVAKRLGVHQSTVSRRVADGLKRLHERLQAAGVTMAAVPLADLLVTHAAPGGPDLGDALARIAMAGAAGGAFGFVGAFWAKAKAWTMLVGALGVPLVLQFFLEQWFTLAITLSIWAWIAWRRPVFAVELSVAQGGQGYDYPFFPFKRWTWTSPPPGWRKALASALGGGVAFVAMAWAVSTNETPLTGLVANMAALAALFLSTAVRIAIRVRSLRSRDEVAATEARPQPPSGIVVAQGLLLPCVAFLAAGCMMLMSRQAGGAGRSMLLMGGIMIVIGVVAAVAGVRNWQQYRAAGPRPIGEGADPGRGEEPAPASEKPAPAGVGGLVFFLVTIVYITTLSAVQNLGLAPVSPALATTQAGRVHRDMAGGMQPAMALMFLTIALPLFVRGRRVMRRGSWLFAVAVAVLCAGLDLCFCLAWVASSGG